MFGGGDQAYLRDVQYGDGRKLDVRARLHLAYSTSATTFAEFESGLLDWPPEARVLECGCGTGRFWLNDHLPRTMPLVLTDLSPGMVDEAVATAAAAGFDDVTGRACDVQALPFADAEPGQIRAPRSGLGPVDRELFFRVVGNAMVVLDVHHMAMVSH